MTMARVKDGEVVEVGLPDDLKDATPGRLHHYGWRHILGKTKPDSSELPEGFGYEYTAPYTYDAEEDAVYGTWKETDVKYRVRKNAVLTRAEFKLALLDMGELDNVKAAMDASDADPRAVILWNDALRFHRTDSDLLRLAEELGYTEDQLDIVFGIISDNEET